MKLKPCNEAGCPELSTEPRCLIHRRVQYRKGKATRSPRTESRELKVNRRRLFAVTTSADPCPWCGRALGPRSQWSIDHVVAVANHGDDSIENLVIMHGRCNTSKGAGPVAVLPGGRMTHQAKSSL